MLLFFFLSTIVLSFAAYLVRRLRITQLLVFVHTLLLAGLAFHEVYHYNETEYIYFKTDYLGLIFLILQVFLGFVTQVHYITYARKRKTSIRNICLHNAGVIFYNGAIAGVLLSAHFGVLWSFVEATTLGAAILIYHDRHEHAIEATWKYLFVCSIGIAIAFAGILFLAVALKEVRGEDLFFSTVSELASKMDTKWLKICFLLILTGFSVKLGIVPMFNVDIDAKDVAPSPVGAMLSSILMNAGFVTVYRFYYAFAHTSILPWMNHVLIIAGITSLFFAAVYVIRVRNIKRILAYSSMEHAALVILALASGGVGYFAAVFHLILHSLIKAALFLQVDQIHTIFNSKLDEDIGQYFKINPIGGLVFFLGFLSAIALPPSGLFVSEFMIFQAIFNTGNWWLLIGVVLLVTIIIYGLASTFLPMLFMHSKTLSIRKEGIVVWESIIQLGLIVLVFYLGVSRPEFLIDAINQAISGLPK